MTITTITIIITSFLVSCFTVKKVIVVSHAKHLFDEPTEDRKVHIKKTPNLGGIGIFVSILFVLSFYLQNIHVSNIGYLFVASLVLFILGLTDDLVGLDPFKKLFAQLLVAVLTTTLADYRIENLFQLFGIGVLPYWVSILLSSLVILFIVNAINLIDGINTLAASVSLLACFIFAVYFYMSGDLGFFYLCISTIGAVCGFLVYNITPARIFMGDTGSMILGFVISVCSIRFYRLYSEGLLSHNIDFVNTVPAAAFLYALLIIPVLDTSRVFILRLINRRSPFVADRNHIHHMLLDVGLTHIQATVILVSVNISCLLIAFLLRETWTELSLLIITGFVLFLLMALQLSKGGRMSYNLSDTKRTKFISLSSKGTVTIRSPFSDNALLSETK